MSYYTQDDFDISKLGSFYAKDKTIFKVFVPEAESVFLIIDNNKYEMHKDALLFEITLEGDLEYAKYYYENDLGISFKDPLAYYSDDKYSYVLDENKFEKTVVRPHELKDTVIYEASVRDFSCDEFFLTDKPRTFLALAQSGLKIADYYMLGLDYISNLGISHLQLLPVFDFDLDNSEYNWGYNPLAYNYVYRDYVVDKDEPYAYINELRKAVNRIHEKNIRVNLDVVFNHVYRTKDFDLGKMLGGQSFRYKKDGTFANGTLCGNELKSEDVFVRAYLVEMVKRYIGLFDIDGIRIDLMGILDYETVNLISAEAKKIKADFMVYGEGWNMGDVLDVDKRACIINADKMPEISMFNDFFRDTIINYVSGNNTIIEDVKKALYGGSTHLACGQSINYVECHDNLTLFDRMIKYKGSDPLWVNSRRCKLALALVMVARGKAFIHMGQEFLRTKNMIENSYNCSEAVNKIDWNRRVEYNDICDYLKALVEIRKANGIFAKEDVEVSFEDYHGCLIYRLDDYMLIINPSIHDHLYQDGNNYDVLFDVNGKGDYRSVLLSVPAHSLIITKRIIV